MDWLWGEQQIGGNPSPDRRTSWALVKDAFDTGNLLFHILEEVTEFLRHAVKGMSKASDCQELQEEDIQMLATLNHVAGCICEENF